MLETFTIGSVKTFIETLRGIRDLFQGVTARDRTTFNHVVKPVFENIQRVVDDYIKIYRTALTFLESGKEAGGAEGVRIIAEHRDQFLVARIEVRALIRELTNDTKYRKFDNFLEKADRIFWVIDPLVGPERMSNATAVLHLFEAVEKNDLSRAQAAYAARQALRNLEHAFEAIAASYARLRIDYGMRGTA